MGSGSSVQLKDMNELSLAQYISSIGKGYRKISKQCLYNKIDGKFLLNCTSEELDGMLFEFSGQKHTAQQTVLKDLLLLSKGNQYEDITTPTGRCKEAVGDRDIFHGISLRGLFNFVDSQGGTEPLRDLTIAEVRDLLRSQEKGRGVGTYVDEVWRQEQEYGPPSAASAGYATTVVCACEKDLFLPCLSLLSDFLGPHSNQFLFWAPFCSPSSLNNDSEETEVLRQVNQVLVLWPSWTTSTLLADPHFHSHCCASTLTRKPIRLLVGERDALRAQLRSNCGVLAHRVETAVCLNEEDTTVVQSFLRAWLLTELCALASGDPSESERKVSKDPEKLMLQSLQTSARVLENEQCLDMALLVLQHCEQKMEPGPDTKSLRLSTLCNKISAVLDSALRLEEALLYANKALALKVRLLGETHVDVGSTYSTIAKLLFRLDRLQEALDVLLSVERIYSACLSPTHPYTNNARKSIEVIRKRLKTDS